MRTNRNFTTREHASALKKLVLSWLSLLYFKYLNSSKITLIRDGGLGDAVMSTASIAEFKKKYPKTQINLIADHPSIFKYFNLNIAQKHKFPAIWLTYGHYDLPFFSKKELHIKEIMARMLGLTNIQNMEYNIGELEDKRFINKHISGHKYIVVQPKASTWFPEKDWTLNGWIKLVSGLRNKGLEVYQIGAIHEEYIDGAVDFRGKTNLDQSMLLIKHATLLIGVNSFGEQAASALGTRSIILYGPTNPKYSLNPNQLAIFNHNCVEYYELSELSYRFSNLDSIEPEFVFEHVMKSLSN